MTTQQSTAVLSGLSRHLRGRLLVPGDANWDTARRPWNLRVDQRPAAIVEPEGAEDMAATVAFATRHGLRVSVQSSGHGAGADLSDTIMLRTSALREITIDTAGDVVKVGAGARALDLAAALPPHGLAASLGSGPTVGVAGYTMFGGTGALGRSAGFMAHKVAAADVVTADGTRLRCDAATHLDLLWALRGGGGGYALVTRLELRLDRVPELFGGQVVWPAAAAPEVFGAWRDWTAALPPEMTSSVGVISLPSLPQVPESLRGARVATVTACYAGPADNGAAALGELTAQTPAPMVNACRPLTAADLANLWNVPGTPIPTRIRGELLSGLPDEAIGELLRLAGQDPRSPIMMAQVRHLGGKLAQDPPGGGAIGRCEAPYQLEMLGLAVTPEADQAIQHSQHAITTALAPWTTGMTLPGFAQPPLDTAERVYPSATRDHLRRVKDRYDPNGIILPGFPR
ncbi:MAG TPA: FAD-binding oxidoreductase [Streptosporangiaceae bacterium]|nr:FAD-binding oxidoreductase [Streptosporangiaceae bacterium]